MSKARKKGRRKRRPSNRLENAPAAPAGPGRGSEPGAGRRRLLLIAACMILVVVAAVIWRARRDGGVERAETAAGGARPSAPPGEVRREPGLDVLLITIDTLRADALGSYGRNGAGTPWMDRLAAEGVRFERAHAHNVVTLPSHANLLSGLYPQEHGVRDNAGFRFPEEIPTLATLLAERGYRTGAFVSAFPLDSRFGLARGFEEYEDSFADATSRPAFLEQERAGPETVALALEWLSKSDDRPNFAWVHLYEPHFPYAPPAPLAERFRGNPYQGDVAAADSALRPLLEPLLAEGAAGGTLVVLTSDHGEALGEHGEATHGIFAYEGVLRVPLVFYSPLLFEPREVDAPARHVDVLPTILDALSIPEPDGLRGRSLLAAAVGQEPEEPQRVYFEALSGQLNRGWAPLFGVIDRGWKYVDLPIPELYDLQADPEEAVNLMDSEPARLAAARDLLAPLRELDAGRRPSPESAEVRRRLSALGYLGAESAETARTYGVEDDPKNLIELDAVLREVATLHEGGDLRAALARSRELVRRRPGMRVALIYLAQLEREAGNLEAAVGELRKAFALQPDDASTLALLATYLTQAGREAEAVEVTEAHARLERPDLEVLLTRGLALARLRRPREALETFRKAEALDPGNAKVSIYLGTFYLMGGQRDRARAAYEEALELNPKAAGAHRALAMMSLDEGRLEAALAHWRSAVAFDAGEHAKLLQVGMGLWRSGRRELGRPLLELFETSAPSREYARDLAEVRRILAAPDPG